MNAEVVSRLEQSFDQTTPDSGPLTELIAAQRKTIRTQEVAEMMLRAYLIEVINSLPKKMQSDERIHIAARFAMGYDDDGDESQAFQMPLAMDRGTQPENVHATVRGRDVDTGVPLSEVLKPSNKQKNKLDNNGATINKVILVGNLGLDPDINYLPRASEVMEPVQKTPPNTGPTRSPNARKLIPKK